METYRLWLEDDEVPQLKKLRYETVPVSLSDVITHGIHPIQARDDAPTTRFVDFINRDEAKPGELEKFGYYYAFSHATSYCDCRFEYLLENVRNNVRFVDGLSYTGLLTIARENLQHEWRDTMAHSMLHERYSSFDDARRFLKSKDASIKVSSREALKRLDLEKLLSIADFDGEDNLIITHGVPVHNFRSTGFLNQITDDQGRLKLTDAIRDFEFVYDWKEERLCGRIKYNCHYDNEKVSFIPELPMQPSARMHAKAFALEWRTDKGRYCFATDIDHVEQMLDRENYLITFPSLNYSTHEQAQVSSATIPKSSVPTFAIGRFPTHQTSGDVIRGILLRHRISITGRKEELLEKLTELAVKLYEERRQKLDDFFTKQRYVRVNGVRESDHRDFPVLESLDLRNLLLTMYAMKHLRGNVILEASHTNDTYDLQSLAKALIHGEVTLEGFFLKAG